MIDALRNWTNDDGTEYVVITSMGIISKGFFARAEPQPVIEFQAPSGETWVTAYGSSTSLHREPDFELRHYLGTAKHDPPVRGPRDS
jgi:hypothetical protein